MEKLRYLTFDHAMPPLLFVSCFAALVFFFWRFSAGLRHRLVRRNYITLLVLECLLFLGILFMLCEPAVRIVTLRKARGRLIVLFDGSASTHLRKDSPWKLMYQAENPIRENSRNYVPEYYLFSETVKRLDERKIRVPEMPEGTRIVHAIETILERTDPLDDRVVLLFSDGRDRVETADLDRLKLRGVPVYTVGLGESASRESGIRDAAVTGMDLNPHLPVLNLARIRGRFRVLGGNRETLFAELLANGEVLSRKNIRLSRGKKEYETEFEWRPPRPETVELEIRVSPLSGETELENNRVVKKTRVIAKSNRVLWIQGSLNWEYAFLRETIFPLTAFEIHSLVLAGKNRVLSDHADLRYGFPGRENLLQYGCLVLADCDPGFFTENQLRDIESLTAEKGAGLVFLAGENFFNPERPLPAPFLKLLPVRAPETRIQVDRRTQGVRPAKGEARKTIFKNFDSKLLERDYELDGIMATGGLKPIARLILDTLSPGSRTDLVPAAYQRFGAGRVVYAGFDSSWKWFFREKEDTAKIFYEQFWKSLFVFATDLETPDKSPPLMIETENAVHVQNRPVNLTVVIRDTSIEGISENMTLVLTDPRDRDYPLPWKLPFGKPGHARASFTPKSPGTYRVRARLKTGPEVLSDRLVVNVRKDLSEYEDLTLNAQTLKRIARATGGAYLTETGYRSAPFRFERGERLRKQAVLKPLWNGHAIFWTLVSVMAVSWILRRNIHLE